MLLFMWELKNKKMTRSSNEVEEEDFSFCPHYEIQEKNRNKTLAARSKCELRRIATCKFRNNLQNNSN